MSQADFLALAAGVTLGGMTLLWLVSLALRNSGIVDVYWGIAFVILAWLGVAFGEGNADRRLLMATMVTIWGCRLAIRIGMRNLGKPEDFRYAAWRTAAGSSWWWRSLFKVFWLQGAVATVVALPVIAVAVGATPEHLTVSDGLGAFVWAVGLAFEAVGDLQLDRFKADGSNRGRIMDRGLWAWTRHPNYFGDALLWWGLGLVGLLTPWGIPALIGPALMTWVLVAGSGVAMLERSMVNRPGWDTYSQRTSVFIPRPPRKP